MKTLRTLFLEELADRYDGERQLVHEMPAIITATTCSHLKELLSGHLRTTFAQVTALERVFDAVCERPQTKRCEAMVALIREATETVHHFQGSPALNAAIVAAVQKIEHYEIASYGCLREWAAVLDYPDAANLLESIAKQEGEVNKALTKLSRSTCNPEAHADDHSEIDTDQILGTATTKSAPC